MKSKFINAIFVVAAMFSSARAQESPPPWKPELDRIAAARDEVSKKLDEILKLLKTKVAGRPDLLAKLSEAPPPMPLPTGFGVLPRLDPDEPIPEDYGPPIEHYFNFQLIRDWAKNAMTYSTLLQADVESNKKPLDALVDAYLARRRDFGNLDSQVGYHYTWQPEARRTPEFFARFNELIEVYRIWRSTESQGVRDSSLRRLEREIISFSPTSGLHISSGVLRMRIATEIEDKAFLAAFEAAIDSVWNRSAAMQKAGLRIEIEWNWRDPKSLYPEGIPTYASPIDLELHLERFGPGLVVAMGSPNTKAFPGRAIHFGPSVSPHGIAHEFAHLLGFSDGYLRAYKGSPDAEDGVEWWEITPFPEDLISSPGKGKVTDAMVERMTNAYR